MPASSKPTLCGIFVTIIILALMSTAYPQNLFNSDGRPLKKQAQDSKEPIVVIDTVRMSGGFGTLRLSGSFSSNKHSVSATATGRMNPHVTQILSDTTDAVNYYGVRLFTDSLIIKSSQTDDSGLVAIRIDIR